MQKTSTSVLAFATSKTAHILVVGRGHTGWAPVVDLLRDTGYRVSHASSARAALAVIDAKRVDLVIAASVGMNGGDGGVTHGVRQRLHCRDLPVIRILRARVHDGEAVEIGADDFIHEPVEAGELLQRVRIQLLRAVRIKELLRATRVDALTGLLNRAGIVDELQRELRRFNRTKAPLYVMMIDLDEFKRINDTCGHLVGDQVLREIASGLSRSLRTTDRIGRLGGDEFLCVLPDCDGARSHELLARVRQVRVQSQIDDDVVRLSVGGTAAKLCESLEPVVRRADAAMYVDKAHARTRRARRLSRPDESLAALLCVSHQIDPVG